MNFRKMKGGSIYGNAAKAVPEGLAQAVKSTGKIIGTAAETAESGARIGQKTVKTGESAVGAVQQATEALEEHSKELTGTALNIGQAGLKTGLEITKSVGNHAGKITNSSLNTATSAINMGKYGTATAATVVKGLSSATSMLGSQLNKSKVKTNARTLAFEKTKNQRANYESQSILRALENKKIKANMNSRLKTQQMKYNEEQRLFKIYINIIDSRIKDMSNNINILLDELNNIVCKTSYFSTSYFSSKKCKKIKSFNITTFQLKINSFKSNYLTFINNIIRKLKNKLQLYINNLEIFDIYFNEQLQVLGNINDKLIDIINNMISIFGNYIDEENISQNNKLSINQKLINLRNSIKTEI